MENRYIRQITYRSIGEAGQEQLRQASAVVIGLGAVGSRVAELLVRSGVGRLRLVDRDSVYESNLPRMSLYTEADAAEELPKAAAAAEHLKRVNRETEIESFAEDLNSRNVDFLLTGMDLVIDGTDNFETKFLLGEACRHLGLPWIYSMVVGSSGQTQNFLPDENLPCLRCIMHYDGTKDAPTCLTEGVLSSTTAMIAAAAASEAVKILVKSKDVRREMLYMDDWHNIVRKITLRRDPECPVCAYGQYSFYGISSGMQAAALCGRDSVQVIPATEQRQDFEKIAARLRLCGTVRQNAFTLDFDNGSIDIKLFRNGRAVIQHVTDKNRAKSIYNRYIGDVLQEEGREGQEVRQ